MKVDDNSPVILKRVSQGSNTEELEIVRYLAEEPRTSDPRNHSVPIFDILQPPDHPSEQILVMALCRRWDSPEFETVGEVADCIRQLLEGIHYLHEHRIAHRDIKRGNFMMDASLFTKPFHPLSQNRSLDGKRQVHARYTRTQRRPKYYIIDFGLSRRYEESQMPPFEIGKVFGSDMTVPEFRSLEQPHNPFPIDVYCLGNMIQTVILESEPEHLGFACLVPLLAEMTDQDPSKRPQMADVLSKFDTAVASLSGSTLRSRFSPTRLDLDWIDRITQTIPFTFRRAQFALTRTPPIPRALN